MQRATGIPSGTKEKLVFVGVAALLSLTVYNLLVSTPVKLEVGPPVSPVVPPGPLDPDKIDTRVSDVRYYRIPGKEVGIADPKTGQFNDRSRANPFQPLGDDSQFPVAGGADDPHHPGGTGKGKSGTPIVGPIAPPPDDAPAIAVVEEKKPEKPGYARKILKANVDFSGVMMMNNQICGLLKSLDGEKTMLVKVGDYLDEYKYTVASIEKQAIYVKDDEDRMFVARDITFDADSGAGAVAAGDGDEPAAPKKKRPLGGVGDTPAGPQGGGGGKPPRGGGGAKKEGTGAQPNNRRPLN
jgi:hypothetical protein